MAACGAAGRVIERAGEQRVQARRANDYRGEYSCSAACVGCLHFVGDVSHSISAEGLTKC
jgi:hypothetical protein